MTSRSVFSTPTEFVALAIRENWFTAGTGSGGSGGGLIKELIHLIAQYFCVHCTLPPPCLCDSAQIRYIFKSGQKH